MKLPEAKPERQFVFAAIALSVLWVVSTALFFVADHVETGSTFAWRRVVKPFPAWCVGALPFVASALLFRAGGRRQLPAPLLTGSTFLLYGAADVAIDSEFVLGAALFIAGHVCYCLGAFAHARSAAKKKRGLTPLRLGAVIAATAVVECVSILAAVYVARGRDASASSDDNQTMGGLIWVYLSLFSPVAACSAAWWPKAVAAVPLLGSALYLASDFLIVWRKFVAPINAPGAVMALYVLACLINGGAAALAHFMRLRQLLGGDSGGSGGSDIVSPTIKPVELS